MRTCALCHRKLGLGTRFRNIWNGRWWVHVRFCSVRCEGIYQVKRNEEAKQFGTPFLPAAVCGVDITYAAVCLLLLSVVTSSPGGTQTLKLRMAQESSEQCTHRCGVGFDGCIRTCQRSSAKCVADCNAQLLACEKTCVGR
jgi:hypothetical protein